jgi:hypothetical protein
MLAECANQQISNNELMAFQTYKAISIYLIYNTKLMAFSTFMVQLPKNPYFQNYIVGIYPLLGYPAI